MKLGAHQSIVGGFHHTADRAARIGLESVQIFTKAPQTWSEPTLLDTAVESFLVARQTAKYTPDQWVVHASYLVNTCSETPQTRMKAVASLIAEAKRCDRLHIPYLVFHPGSPGKLGSEAGIAMVAEAILNILDASSTVQLLIENTAGTGKSIGHSFEQIKQIIDLAHNHPRIGVCFDTAHAFAAGYNLADVNIAPQIFEKFDHIVGLDALKVIHLNDSKTGLGSRIDRHERVGHGRIGADFFRWMVNAAFAENIPGILETPLKKGETYEKDIQTVKEFRTIHAVNEYSFSPKRY